MLTSGISTFEYHEIWLADFFHGFPHLDLSFSETNSTFNPENENYREVLEFWAGIPLICCGVLWLMFLIFFCVRCHRRHQSCSAKRSSVCSGLFLVFVCGALAVNFYGNTEVHDGMSNAVGHMKTSNKTIQASLQTINTVDRMAEDVETKRVPALIKAVSAIPNSTVRGRIVQLIHEMGSDMGTTMQDIQPVRNATADLYTRAMVDTVDHVEYIRWVVTIVVCCVYIVIILLAFVGLLKKSRRKLILAAVLSIICLPVMWTLTSTHLALAVGGGDLCVDPNSYMLSLQNDTAKADILLVYMECKDKSQPFGEAILQAQTSVTKALTSLNVTLSMSAPFNVSDRLAGPVRLLQNNLHATFGNLSSLFSMVGSCQTLHNLYIQTLKGACNTALYGVGYLVLSTCLLALFSAALVVCLALIWPSSGKGVRGHGHGYEPVDDTDPFVPTVRSRQPGYGSFMPAYLTTANLYGDAGSINGDEDPARPQYQLRETPPPAYQPSHLQEYSNLAPTPSSMGQSLR